MKLLYVSIPQALQAAFNLPPNVDQAEAQSRWQDAHLNPDQRDFSMADHKFKEVANQVNNDINKVTHRSWLLLTVTDTVPHITHIMPADLVYRGLTDRESRECVTFFEECVVASWWSRSLRRWPHTHRSTVWVWQTTSVAYRLSHLVS